MGRRLWSEIKSNGGYFVSRNQSGDSCGMAKTVAPGPQQASYLVEPAWSRVPARGSPNLHPSCRVTGPPIRKQTSNQGEDCPTVLDTYTGAPRSCIVVPNVM